MIYITEQTEEIWLPKYYTYKGEYTLTLENNLTHEVYDYPNLVDTVNNNYFHCFSLNLSLPVGEYTYTITSDYGKDTGLLTFGDYFAPSKQYTTNQNITQYEG